MILAIILLFTALTIATTMLISAIIGGISFIVAFSDVIVFGLIVFLLIKILRKR